MKYLPSDGQCSYSFVLEKQLITCFPCFEETLMIILITIGSDSTEHPDTHAGFDSTKHPDTQVLILLNILIPMQVLFLLSILRPKF
jgi:hypothetical protein